MDKLNR